MNGNIKTDPKLDDLPYTQAPHALFDCGISLKAIALFIYLRGCPPGWTVTLKSLVSAVEEGRSAVRSGLQELEDAGLLSREVQRDDRGYRSGTIYTLHAPDVDDESLDAKTNRLDRKIQRRTIAGHNKHDSKEVCESAGAREDNPSDSADTDPDDYSTAASPTAGYYQRVLDLPELPYDERVEHGELQQWWREYTGERIDPFGPKHSDDVVAICRTFTEDQIREAMKAAARPGITYRWSYFTSALEKAATENRLDKADSERAKKYDDPLAQKYAEAGYSDGKIRRLMESQRAIENGES